MVEENKQRVREIDCTAERRYIFASSECKEID
jgi:hypothetical protein